MFMELLTNLHGQHLNICVYQNILIFFLFRNLQGIILSFWKLCGLKFVIENDKGDRMSNIWLFYSLDINIDVISNTSQQITLRVIFNNLTMGTTRVCAHSNYLKRISLWMDLLNIYMEDIDWFFVGDFNCILGSNEKRGGFYPKQVACDDFMPFSNVVNLIHMHKKGVDFTWYNGRLGMRHIEVRLDRVLHNSSWIDNWSATFYCTLNRQFSDHVSLLLNFDVFIRKSSRTYMFSKTWTMHLDFFNMVKQNWEVPIHFVYNFMMGIMIKLKRLKKQLKL